MVTQEQLKNLTDRVSKLKGYLEIEKKLIEISNDEEKTADPSFWNNPKDAEVLMKSLRFKKKWVEDYQKAVTLNEDIHVLFDFYKEGEVEAEEIEMQFEKAIAFVEDIEFKNMLSEEGDSFSAVIQITAGAGGTESCDWAEMLFRMYSMWSEKQGFTLKTLNYQSGDSAGIKTVTVEVDGDYAFGWLKGENGVHRLVRISPFDSANRRHTSFASVFVYPSIEENIEIDINPTELRIDTYRASGAGGQHVNKTDSAVRITHLPTGIVSQCQNERSQHKNKNQAMKILKSRLYQLELEKEKEKNKELEDQKLDIGWGSQIRSYVFHPYQMVKDHRTKEENGNTQSVMDGNLSTFIRAYLLSTI